MSHKKIRLGFYMYTPAIGGAEQYLRDLLWKLDRERYSITLFHENWQPFVDFLGLDSCPGVSLYPIPIYETSMITRNANILMQRDIVSRLKRMMYFFLWTPRNYFLLKQALEFHPVDILHVNNGGYPASWTAQLVSLASKETGVPVCIMTISNTPSYSRSGLFWKLFDQKIERSVDQFVAVADHIKHSLVEQRGFSTKKIKTIYYGTELPLMGSINKIAFRVDLGLPTGHLLIGIAARIAPEKGHTYLLQAISKLRNQIENNVTVLIIGDGPYRDTIQSLAQELHLEHMLIFTGRLSNQETLQYISVCDIMTLPSEYEGLPYMIIEAMSLGKPVVATKVGGVPEQILHGKTGLLVSPRDPDALAEALLYLINNPDLRRQMGIEAKQRHQSLFTLERMLQEYDSMYQFLFENSSNYG